MKIRKKGYKIKKYNRIFDSSSRRRKRLAGKIFIYVLVFLLLCFIGYSISEPLSNFLKGEKTDVGGASSQISSLDKEQGNISSGISQTETLEQIGDVKIAYLSRETAKDSTKLALFADTIKSRGYTHAVIELKNTYGNVFYNSNLESVKAVSAVDASAINVVDVLTMLKQKGITPIAEINAFKDVIGTKNSEAKIKYAGNSSWSWLDRQEGGKPWLNPYSSAAQKYITDIALELTTLGFENIMVSSVMFPDVKTGSYADFGEIANTVSRDRALSDFTASLKTALNSKGAKLMLRFNYKEAIDANNIIYGGKNPLSFSADVFVPEASLSDYSGRIELQGEVIEDAALDAAQTLSLVSKDIKAVAGDKNLTLIISGKTDLNGKTYTDAQIEAQINALKSQSIQSYYVFDRNSNY